MITVYSTDPCVQCKATYKALDKAGIDYTVIDITDDQPTRDWLKDSYGYKQSPVVIAGDEHWSGYRVERIRAIPAELRRAPAASAPDPPARHGTRIVGGVEIPEYAAPDVAAVEQWTARVRHAAADTGPVPTLGSPDWIALGDTDPRKLAAVVESALAHTRTLAALPTELDRDMAVDRAEWQAATTQANDAVHTYLQDHPEISPARRSSHRDLQRARYGEHADEITARQALAHNAGDLPRRHGQDFPAPAAAALTTTTTAGAGDAADITTGRSPAPARTPAMTNTSQPAPLSI